tara:strand:- start:368 stop:1366 length:999 start_codon:yes stop_codon:yes gene_type:complete
MSIKPLVGITVALVVLIAILWISLWYGVVKTPIQTVFSAIFDYDPENYEQVVIRKLRAPRTLIGLIVGASLACAGALSQGLTRNPLASPGLLGINAGAAFGMVAALSLANLEGARSYVWFALTGAFGASILVHNIARIGRQGATPVKIALSGVIVTALLGSWTSALLLLNEQTLDEARFWLVGSISGRGTDALVKLSPLMACGLLAALALGRELNINALGQHTSTSLGQRIRLFRALTGLTIIVLCGCAVAIAGPISFVGLAIPHIARSIVGSDYRWILPYSLFLGPCLLIGADILGRIVIQPRELQAGIVTAVLGAPILILLVRNTRLKNL